MLKQIFLKMLFKITLDRKHNNIYIILAELTGVARGIYNHKFCLAFVTPGVIIVTPGVIIVTPGVIIVTPGVIIVTPGVIIVTPGVIKSLKKIQLIWFSHLTSYI